MSIVSNKITKIYGTQKALNNVSFEIKPGEVVGLLGPNGAGKSTMMKIITCFITQTEGEITVNGFDTIENPGDVRKIIGYLPENNPLYFEMYIREYLTYIAGIYKLGKNKKESVNSIIKRTGLTSELNKKIGALSKGFRQRVGLAQALIHDPDVLILDEPTSGLDPNQLIEIRNLIKEIGKEKTIILSTHIMQEVEAICDRAIIIHEGNIVADDSTQNLSRLASDQNIITVEFSEAINQSKLLKIPEIIEIKEIDKNIWKIISGIKKDIRSDVFEFAVKNNVKVLSLNKQKRSLEQVFQSLTSKPENSDSNSK